MGRKEITSDGKYFIYPIANEDREDYVELKRQINGETTLFKNPITKDIMWETTLTGVTKVYSIYNSENKYCGNIELQNPTSETPEMGIELLENFRNKGIAPTVIPMFVRAVCDQHNVQHFIIKIAASNSHSRHIFDKLGAEFIGEEESFYKKIVKMYKEMCKSSEKAYELAKRYEADDEPVYVYKLPTDIVMPSVTYDKKN